MNVKPAQSPLAPKTTPTLPRVAGVKLGAARSGVRYKDRDDIMLANHRAHGQLLAKGSDPGRLLAELAGRTNGVARGRGGSFHPSDFTVGVFASSGSVGHGAPLATGAASGMC